MTDERQTTTDDTNEPNEFGFAGAATAPQPQPDAERRDEVDGESIAVPAGDITGAITEAIEELTDRDGGADRNDGADRDER